MRITDHYHRRLTPASCGLYSPYDHLNAWIGQIEERGILVTQMSDVSIEEARGFSIGRYPLPVIAINGAETSRGKLFTLLHEVVHILLRRSALCDLEDAATPSVEAEGGGSNALGSSPAPRAANEE
jgi:Zn-dependent peptidase ImmA (M78 family)